MQYMNICRLIGKLLNLWVQSNSDSNIAIFISEKWIHLTERIRRLDSFIFKNGLRNLFMHKLIAANVEMQSLASFCV